MIQFRARVALMRGIEPDAGWPDLSDAALIASVRDWLAPHLHGMTRLAELERLDLVAILRGLLPWHLAARLDQALPTHLTLPHGSAPVDYTEPVPIAAGPRAGFLRNGNDAAIGGGTGEVAAGSVVSGWPAHRHHGATSPVSGKAHGRMRAATCAGDIRSTTGRRMAVIRETDGWRPMAARRIRPKS